MAEDIPEGIPVEEFCKKKGISYGDFVLAKPKLKNLGILHQFRGVQYIRPEDEGYLKAFLQGDESELEETASQARPAVPSPTAMIAPPTELSEKEVDALVDEVAEERTRHIPQELVQQATGEGGTSRETAEKSSDWETIVDERINRSVPPKTRYAPAPPQGAMPPRMSDLAARSRSNRLLYDMIRQNEKSTPKDSQHADYRTERQVDTATAYQEKPSQDELIAGVDASMAAIGMLVQMGIQDIKGINVALPCVMSFLERCDGLREASDPYSRISVSLLEKGLNDFFKGYTRFCSDCTDRGKSFEGVEEIVVAYEMSPDAVKS
ncbi:hypothetical protein KY361_02065 [Candidatus Woesearchaeota archaeon]|nr:hypothetical protein [Candidatus Woesearchaeota archaeon]